MNSAIKALRQYPLELVEADSVVRSQVDALKAAKKLGEKNIDALAIMAANWTRDAVSLSAIYELRVPVVLWAISYPATYSLAVVEHVASILKEMGIKYRFVYGEPSESDSAKQISNFAKVASVFMMLRGAKIGLVGPRPTWRISGPTDTTYEEMDIRRKFGCEIVHIEMGYMKSRAEEVSDQEARRTIEEKMSEGKIRKVEVKDTVLLAAAKNYVALKKIMNESDLRAVAVECYPEYPGLTCLPASWLAEEGLCGLRRRYW